MANEVSIQETKANFTTLSQQMISITDSLLKADGDMQTRAVDNALAIGFNTNDDKTRELIMVNSYVQQGDNRIAVSVPLLALVDLSAPRIETMDINVQFSINNSSKTADTTDVSSSIKAGGEFGLGIAKASFEASVNVGHKHESEKLIDTNGKLDISCKIVNKPITLGFRKLQDSLLDRFLKVEAPVNADDDGKTIDATPKKATG